MAPYRPRNRPGSRPAGGHLRRAVLGRSRGGTVSWPDEPQTPTRVCLPSAAQSSTAARPRQWRLRRRTRWAQAPTIDPTGQPSKAAATKGTQDSDARPADGYPSRRVRCRDESRARDLADHASASMAGRSPEGLSSGLLCADWARDSNFEELHRPGGERRGLVRGEVHRVRDGIAVRFNPRHQHGAPLGARLSLSDDGHAADPLRRNRVPHNSVAADRVLRRLSGKRAEVVPRGEPAVRNPVRIRCDGAKRGVDHESIPGSLGDRRPTAATACEQQHRSRRTKRQRPAHMPDALSAGTDQHRISRTRS